MKPARPGVYAAIACIAVLGPVALASAQTTTAPDTTTTATAAQAPVLRNIKTPATVSAQQGHARFLVGVRVSAPSTLTAQIFNAENAVVRTVNTRVTTIGRAYVRIEATSQQGYQLPAGKYRIQLQAADARGRTSNVLSRNVTLALTPPRGRLDGELLQLWPAMARSLRIPNSRGQLVTGITPRGQMVKAGIRRWDVITAIDGKPTLTTGQAAAALRALPADKEVPVEIRRGTSTQTVQLTVPADWTSRADLTATYRVAQRRSPRVMAIGVSAVLYQVSIGKTAEAQRLWRAMPRAWQTAAPGQYAMGRIFERQRLQKQALGAYNRALARDRSMAEAAVARATLLSQMQRNAHATRGFASARRLDPHDATTAAFHAFSLVREKRNADALAPAREAVRLEAGLGESQIAMGIGLILNKQPARGLVNLRDGIMLTDNQTLARQVIRQYLEPSDK